MRRETKIHRLIRYSATLLSSIGFAALAQSQSLTVTHYDWHPEFIKSGPENSTLSIDADVPDHWLTNGSTKYERLAIEAVKAALVYVTSLPAACAYISDLESTLAKVHISLREVHNAECGGDPNTAPRLASFELLFDKINSQAWLSHYYVIEGEWEPAALIRYEAR